MHLVRSSWGFTMCLHRSSWGITQCLLRSSLGFTLYLDRSPWGFTSYPPMGIHPDNIVWFDTLIHNVWIKSGFMCKIHDKLQKLHCLLCWVWKICQIREIWVQPLFHLFHSSCTAVFQHIICCLTLTLFCALRISSGTQKAQSHLTPCR